MQESRLIKYIACEFAKCEKYIVNMFASFQVTRHKGSAHGYPTSFRAVMWGVFFFLMFAVLLGVGSEKWLQQHVKEKRNSFFRRGWVEHVLSADEQKRPGKRIVIISNSQGYGPEVSDRETYPALLETILVRQQYGEAQVLNWSIAGGQARDLTILAAAAKWLAPDILIFIDSPADFHRNRMKVDRKKGLRENFVTDSYYLLGYSSIRNALPSGFLSHFFRPIDYVDITLARIFVPWRYREIFSSALMRAEEFRPFDKTGKSKKWFVPPPDSREKYRQRKQRGMAKARKTIHPISTDRMSDELLNFFLDTTRDMTAERYFIFMPLHSSIRKKNILLGQELAARSAAKGFQVVDLSGSIPDKQFLTLTHLTKAGHATMAGLLAGVLEK